MEVIWYKDFDVDCTECGKHHNLGTSQTVVKRFYEPVDVELPCGHSINVTMKTEKEGMKVCSYSQLDMYLQCPFRWKLKYLEKIECNIKSPHLEYGLAVHETNEDFFNALQVGKLLAYKDMKFIFNMYFDNHNIPFEDVDKMLDAYNEGIVMLDRLYNPVNEVEKLMVNTEIIGVEMPFEVVIDGIVIIGYIDLVLKTDEGIILIDHKSGGKVFDKSKLVNNLQFPIYSMAIFEQHDELPLKCFYNFTKLHKCQSVEVTRERLIEFRKEISRIFRKMNDSKHVARPCNLCFWCDYSKHKLNRCKYSSDFKPKPKR